MQERLSKIRLLLLDVDGVLTDGRITYDANGVESKSFDVKDGHGLKMLQRAGIKVGIITGRKSEIVALRARELGIEILHQGAKQKLPPYETVLQEHGFEDREVAYVGDDLVDLPILKRVGFDYVTRRPGGRGAVREVCDLLLKETGCWGEVTGRYFDDNRD